MKEAPRLRLRHFDVVARLVGEVIEDSGWGSVTIYIEDGEVKFVGKESRQRMLDELLDSRAADAPRLGGDVTSR